MAKTPLQIRDLSKSLEQSIPSFVDLSSTIVVPNTSVVNRARIPDLANDLCVRFGNNRTMTQSIYHLQNEFGPNGERVFGVVNDYLNSVRLIGSWSEDNSLNGPHLLCNLNDYLEITFYGTGLTLLTVIEPGGTRDYRATVDGGAEGANFYPASTSGVLNNRQYSQNQLLPVVSGLAQGIHTVKIRVAGSSANGRFFGFEVINNTSTLKVNPGSYFNGGSRLQLVAQQSPAYNSTFESGTLGTKGGRVLTYIKADGSIGKSLTPTDATQLNLTSADHSNEEMIRALNIREFGSGRADDFSLLSTSPGARGFTLDDGTTTLVGSNVRVFSGESLNPASPGSDFITLTFVGTGLDVIRKDDDNSGTAHSYSVTVDGTLLGSYSNAASSLARVEKIVSGLPYGTHTVKLLNTASPVRNVGFNGFIIYGPKKPTIPTGSVEIADYCVVANYSAAGVAGVAVDDNLDIHTGVISKSPVREINYFGTWTINPGFANQFPHGHNTTTSTNGDYFEYTFFGTGITINLADSVAGTVNFTVHIDSVLNATGTDLLSVTNSGAGAYIINTSVNARPARVVFTGLTLGTHTIRVTKTAGGAGPLYPVALGIITPIHSPKSNLYSDLQNTLMVGSCALSDSRVLSSSLIPNTKAIVQAIGVASGPTNTSTVYVPVPDLSVNILVKGYSIDISYGVQYTHSSGTSDTDFIVLVDGVQSGTGKTAAVGQANSNMSISDDFNVPVSPGFHKVDVYYKVSAGTNTLSTTKRNLTVRER